MLSHDLQCSLKASRYMQCRWAARISSLVSYDDIEGSLILTDLLLAFQDHVFENVLR
jgi:hypothetical protein